MSELVGVIVTFFPLLVVMWLANMAQARRERDEPSDGFRLTAYVLLAVFYVSALLVGLMVQLVGVLMEMNPALLEGLPADLTFASLGLLGAGLWGPSLIGLILLLPPVRRLFALFTRLDPDNPVHAVALSFSMLVVINLMVTLGIGLGNMADIVAKTETDGTSTLITLWAQQIITALLAMLGVGWLTRRSFRETLVRLGLVRPTLAQLGIGIGLGLLMVPVVLGIEYLASQLGWGASADVERLTQELLGDLFTSPFGILTLGLSAALGEETIFRGAATPRFGILLSSLLFALVHSNYGITLSTVVVFGLGALLAVLRLRYNTPTAMATHAVYNITLGVLAYLSSQNLGV